MTSNLIRLSALLDDAKCFDLIRQHRWPDGVRCPSCASGHVVRNGDARHTRQRWLCKDCKARFDDLTGTVLAGHHQPLRVWVLCLYFMGLNLSNEQIARELGIDPDDAQVMASKLREGIVEVKPKVTLSGEVECDEVYVVAGHKGHPEAVREKGDWAGGGVWRGPPAGGRWRRRSR